MKVGIFGGTFDPLHIGHLLVAEAVRDELELARVLFVPAGDPPHKQDQSKSAAGHRRAMIEAAIVGDANFDLCSVDLERPGPHYSVDTVRLIQARYQLAREASYFIIGGDSLVDLPDWYQPERLVERCLLAVVHRPGSQPDVNQLEAVIPGLSRALVWVPSPMLDLSGTEIRQRVAAGRSIRYQVPEPVRNYIQQQGLYRS